MGKQVQNTSDLIISGGGIAGLTLAILLAQKGLRIDLIDPYPPERFSKTKPSGRTVALLERSIDLLKEAGVWSIMEPISNPLQTMRIIDDSIHQQACVEIDFCASELGMEHYGYNIPNAPLRAALFENAKTQNNIKLHVPCKLYDFNVHEGGVAARLDNDTRLRAPLIVGCDGRRSMVREIAKIKTSVKHYDQEALTFLIAHDKDHYNTATEFHRPGGPLALVPLPHNQSSVVWVDHKDRAQELLHLKKHDLMARLESLTNRILGPVSLVSPVESWPLCTIRAQSLIAPRAAIAAEAAHVMSPITAQGLNLSLRDIRALRDVIIDAAQLGMDIGHETILKRYEKQRMGDIHMRVHGVDGLNRIVANDSTVIKNLRRRGLKTLDIFSPLKEFVMAQGLAPNH